MNDGSFLKILNDDQDKLSSQLMNMAEGGNLRGIIDIHKSGLNIKICRGLYGFTCLHHACNRGHIQIVSELLHIGVDVNATNQSGETPLHLACYSGRLIIVDLLIDKGANMNACNQYNETPLFYATKRNMPAVTRLLIQRGADTNQIDKFGDKAIDHTADERVRKEFDFLYIPEQTGQLCHRDLVQVFLFLTAKEICRCACVSAKWHRVSESERIWSSLGIRRWEYALKSTLGLPPAPAVSFSRRSSKDAGGSAIKKI